MFAAVVTHLSLKLAASSVKKHSGLQQQQPNLSPVIRLCNLFLARYSRSTVLFISRVMELSPPVAAAGLHSPHLAAAAAAAPRTARTCQPEAGRSQSAEVRRIYIANDDLNLRRRATPSGHGQTRLLKKLLFYA